MIKLPEVRRTAAYHLTQPVVKLIARTSITPNAISWVGFFITVCAAVLIITDHLFTAGIVVLLAGFFDILDGALARHTGRVSNFGALLDSTLDRLAEAVLLLGILVIYARDQSLAPIIIVFVALVGSIMVSYIRARAEASGMECKVGIFTRAERVFVLALGLLLSQVFNALLIALAIIVVFSFYTVGQRIFYVWQQTKKR